MSKNKQTHNIRVYYVMKTDALSLSLSLSLSHTHTHKDRDNTDSKH